MGLDANAYKIPNLVDPTEEIDTEFLKETGLVEVEPIELMYWRKHYNLQDFMEKIYREKGGLEHFNCVRVYLEEKDLERLVGMSDEYEEGEDYSEFIKEAKEALDEGCKVFYDSWW